MTLLKKRLRRLNLRWENDDNNTDLASLVNWCPVGRVFTLMHDCRTYFYFNLAQSTFLKGKQMTQDIFQRMSAAEYRVLTPIKNMVYVNGVAVNSEDELCIQCVKWFDRVLGYQKRFDLIHVPNEGKRTRWEGTHAKAMGLRAGTPDYLLSKDGVPVCWIEFKFGKNGLTDSQKEFRDYAKAGGFGFEVVKTFDEFKAALIKWGVYTQPKNEHRTSFENIFKKGE